MRFYNLFIGAAGESRTHNQLITGQLRCHLRHDSKLEQVEVLNLIRICKRAIDNTYSVASGYLHINGWGSWV